MILSVRLVSCQAPRIHSGLLLMLTLMFLYFTRKEGGKKKKNKPGSALALLSTNAPREAASQQTRFDDRVHNTFTYLSLLTQSGTSRSTPERHLSMMGYKCDVAVASCQV